MLVFVLVSLSLVQRCRLTPSKAQFNSIPSTKEPSRDAAPAPESAAGKKELLTGVWKKKRSSVIGVVEAARDSEEARRYLQGDP